MPISDFDTWGKMGMANLIYIICSSGQTFYDEDQSYRE